MIAANPGAAAAQEIVASGPAIYRLEARSNFQEGCFPPCMCPILIHQPVIGTMTLARTGTDGGFTSRVAVSIGAAARSAPRCRSPAPSGR